MMSDRENSLYTADTGWCLVTGETAAQFTARILSLSGHGPASRQLMAIVAKIKLGGSLETFEM